jgi:hypothetical protein
MRDTWMHADKDVVAYRAAATSAEPYDRTIS